MADKTPILDYTNRDYASLVTAMLDLAAQNLPEWTDRSPNDLGRQLIDLFAYVGDVILYYQDRIANEQFLSTAVERRSVIDLLELIGYRLATPAAATAKLELRAKTQSVTVKAGAKFQTRIKGTKEQLPFVFLPADGADRQFQPGQEGPWTLEVVNADPQSERLSADGKLSQRPVILPPRADINCHYFRLKTRDGVKWERRDSLFESGPEDRHFVVDIDDEDRASVRFGDGRCGMARPIGEITVDYLIGFGARGNVGPGTITQIQGGVSPEIPVSNPLPASGGADREPIEHARQVAPQLFRSQRRAVTAADYEALALSVRSVQCVRAVPGLFGHVSLYVVGAGGHRPQDALKAQLQQLFAAARPLTTVITVRDATFVQISITVRIGADPDYDADEIKRKCEAALIGSGGLYAVEKLRFGQRFYISKIYEVIEAIDGVAFVSKVEVEEPPSNRPSSDLRRPIRTSEGVFALAEDEFPQLSPNSFVSVIVEDS